MKNTKVLRLVIKILLTLAVAIISLYAVFIFPILLSIGEFWIATIGMSIFLIPLILPLIWLKKKKIYLFIYIAYVLCFVVLCVTQVVIDSYKQSITIDVTPNIDVHEYLPFDENSKIVKTDSTTLDFSEIPKDQLPVIDGATAAFPVYSAFVHAVYPDTTELYDGVFEYNNTVGGYYQLAEKETDIFIGAAPSEEQIEYAEECNTTFEYTQIGSEAFVFFVHKDNPIDSLTVEQIKGIYSGEITNWSEVGGSDEKIVPFQRNEGSGSQSMLIRFMGDTPIMPADTETRADGMGGIIEEVVDYKNKSTSIGFSFRYYLEGIIKNPDLKMLAINGVAPTAENIKNSSYPIIAPVYAVTYEGNSNENVQKLIDWMLSDEGQQIINESGYVGI